MSSRAKLAANRAVNPATNPAKKLNRNLSFGPRRLLLAFAALALLAGCAGQAAYREGKSLAREGRHTESLAQFELAKKADPQRVDYRQAVHLAREKALAQGLQLADQLAGGADADAAREAYQRVLALEANNERARSGLYLLSSRERHAQWQKEAQSAWERKDAERAQIKLRSILAENPAHSEALTLQELIRAKPPAESTDLRQSAVYNKPITIEFKDVALKQVFEVISRTSGLNFLFDKDVRTDQKTSIFLKNSTIATAIHFALLTNQLDQQILDANTVLIYPNTANKQKEYQELVIRSFFLANAEAKTVANTLKTILKSRDLVVDEKLNMLILRDSPEAILLAEKLVALHDVPEPEVMLEVEILEVKRTSLLNLGVSWPETLTLTPLPRVGGSGTLTLADLGDLSNGRLGAGIAPLTVNANARDSNANILANPRIRARNHEKAKILIGERVPNITATSTATGFVSESINYVDVGLKLDVEPSIFLDGDVAIKIALEVSNIVSQIQTKSGSVAYQIGTRTASTVLRLKDGENQVLAGLINDEDRRANTRLPLLGDLPLLGRLFGSSNDNAQKTEIVLSITPRLIRNLQRPTTAQAEFRAGTESSMRTRPESGGLVPPAATGRLAGAADTPGTRAPMSAESGNPFGNRSAMTGGDSTAQNPAGLGANNAANNTGNNTAAFPGSGIGQLDAYALPLAGARLSFDGPTQIKAGSEFVVQMLIQSDQPLAGMPITLEYDSKVLQITGIKEGEFFRQGGVASSFTSKIEPNGKLVLATSRSGETGATVPGVVATLTMKALAPAEASLISVAAIAPVGTAGRAVITSQPLPYRVQVQP